MVRYLLLIAAFVPALVLANPVCDIPEYQAEPDIKNNLAQRYPGSYSVQVTLLNSDIQAYRKLCPTPATPYREQVLRTLIDRYYPDLAVIHTLYESETAAYNRLHGTNY